MSPVRALLAATAAAIETVEGAGRVYPRLVQVTTWPEFLDRLTAENEDGDKAVKGWVLEPDSPVWSSAIETLGSSPGLVHELGLKVTGFVGVREVEPEGEEDLGEYSHDDFLDVSTAVKRALDAMEIDMSGTDLSDTTALPTQVQWTAYQMRMFGSVACWVAEMRLKVTLYEASFALGGG